MLRFLILVLFCYSAKAFPEEYREPNKQDLAAQQKHINETLKQTSKFEKNKEFIESVAKQRTDIQQVFEQRNALVNPRLDFLNQDAKAKNIEDILGAGKNINSKPVETTGPIVMVSFSMSDSQIKSLIDEMSLIGGVVVIRGLIDGDFTKTIKKMRSIAQEKSGGVSIDPAAFKRYSVASVPAFILPLEAQKICTDSECPPPSHVKASGSATYRYFLELIERTGSDPEKIIASQWLAKYGD